MTDSDSSTSGIVSVPMVRVTSTEWRGLMRTDENGKVELSEIGTRQLPTRVEVVPADLNSVDLAKGRVITFTGTLFIPGAGEGAPEADSTT